MNAVQRTKAAMLASQLKQLAREIDALAKEEEKKANSRLGLGNLEYTAQAMDIEAAEDRLKRAAAQVREAHSALLALSRA